MSDPVRYSRNLAEGLTGQRADFGGNYDAFTYKQPTNKQDIDLEVTTGAAGTWHAKVTDLTEGFLTEFDFPGDAVAATVAANLIAAWDNSTPPTPPNLHPNWAAVTSGGGAIANFAFNTPNRRYDIVVTPAGAGAFTLTDNTPTQLVAEVGAAAFVDNTGVTLNAQRILVAASAAGIAGFRGVIERTDFTTQTGPPDQVFDHIQHGKAISVVRAGRMRVHVGDAVNPTTAPAVVTTAGTFRLGTFGIAGAGRTAITGGTATARYLTAAAAGEIAVLELRSV